MTRRGLLVNHSINWSLLGVMHYANSHMVDDKIHLSVNQTLLFEFATNSHLSERNLGRNI